VKVPVLGQGTWRMEEDDREGAIRALRLGLDGMTHVDTAELYGYGEVEELVAEALEGRREEVFLVSKVSLRGRGGWRATRSTRAPRSDRSPAPRGRVHHACPLLPTSPITLFQPTLLVSSGTGRGNPLFTDDQWNGAEAIHSSPMTSGTGRGNPLFTDDQWNGAGQSTLHR
jgi:hypothetical protein